jgi:hypothetical protein
MSLCLEQARPVDLKRLKVVLAGPTESQLGQDGANQGSELECLARAAGEKDYVGCLGQEI